MKIWHQSFTVLSDLGPYSDALKAHFARVARPDTQIDMHGMAPGTYSSNYPGSDIRHAALFHLHGMQFMQAGVLATMPTRSAHCPTQRCARFVA